MCKYKKTALIIALSSTAIVSGSAQAVQINAQANGLALESSASTINNNFTVLTGKGGFHDGTNDVAMTWDGTVFTASSDYTGPGSVSNMTLSSVSTFYGYLWTAHDIQVFAPGSYSFDPTLGGGAVEWGTQLLTVGAGQLGAHMLWDWNGNNNVDVVILWNANGVFGNNAAQRTLTGTAVWNAVSVDGDNDGIPGIRLLPGGPIEPFPFNFNLNGITPTPVPAAVWLLGSGLLGILGIVRRKRTNAI